MKALRLLLVVGVAGLLAISSASGTKYYFNSFDTNSLAGWASSVPDGDPNVGLYQWVGGSNGYEMMGYDAALAKGRGAYVNATPSAAIGQDFWMSADFRQTGLYLYSGGGLKQSFVFFVNAAGQGMGVYAKTDRGNAATEIGLVYTNNYYGITSFSGGIVNGLTMMGPSVAFDNTNWDQCRVDLNFQDSTHTAYVYYNGNQVGSVSIPSAADANIVRNFTRVGTYFYNNFCELATYLPPDEPYSVQSIDNIWCGSVADPYQVAHLLPGDANGDLTVDVVDLGILATSWKKGGTTWLGSPISSVKNPGQPIWPTMGGGDFNHDGTVDVVDLGLLATNWKKSIAAPVQPTPEPASMAMLAAAGLGVLARRKR